MSTKGKEYQLAIRIAGIVDKSFSASLASTKGSLAQIQTTINAIDSDFVKLDKGFDGIVRTGEKCFSAIASAAGVASVAVAAPHQFMKEVSSNQHSQASKKPLMQQQKNMLHFVRTFWI